MGQAKEYPLIVEDDKIDYFIINKALKELKRGIDHQWVNNAEAAQKTLEKEGDKISMILLDLNMPGMNGLEFLTWIKKHEVLKDIPIVIYTTSNNEKDIEFCRKMGVEDYIVKPIGYRNVVDALKKIRWS